MVLRARRGAPPAALALALVVAIAETTTSPAAAQTSEPEPDSAVVVRLSGPDDPALRDAIRELLARLHLLTVDAATESAGSSDGGGAATVVARVEIDLSSPTDARVVVTNDAGEVLLRRAVPRDAGASIVREEIAHEVRGAVESALLAARERGPRPESPPPPPPPVAPPPAVEPVPAPAATKERPTPTPRSPAFGLEITTLAGVSPIASDSGPATRVGLGLGALAPKLPLRPSLGLTALYALPFETAKVAPTELSTQTSIASLRVLPALELIHAKWIAAEIGVGAGFDVVTVIPQSNSASGYYFPPAAFRPQTTRIDPIFSAMATVHVGVVPGVVVLLSGGVEVDPESRDYVLRGSTVTDILTPSHIRPMVLAGFGFAALGDGRFGGGGGR